VKEVLERLLTAFIIYIPVFLEYFIAGFEVTLLTLLVAIYINYKFDRG
jgi:hypothetical protein